MKIGDRVVVAIVEVSRWAKGAPERLNGARGVVEEIKPVNSIGTGGVLVRFDTAVPRWPTGAHNTTPHRAFWFDPSEVQPEAVLVVLKLAVPADGQPACGCREGVLLGMNGLKRTNPGGVQRCDECGLFATDEEALGFAIGKGSIVAEDAP